MNYRHRILSLFANIGVAEAYLENIGCHVSVANEVVGRRAVLYNKIYPVTNMICGDITNKSVYNRIVEESRKAGIDVVLATPPCQGMSTVGEQNENDERNNLLIPAIHAIQDLNPQYAVIENVPNFVNTSINYHGERCLLTDIIHRELGAYYNISINIINTDNFDVPQSRERMIALLSRKDCKEWTIPQESVSKVTLRDAIGWIPEIDPFVKDLSTNEFNRLFPDYERKRERALSISRWNIPPVHIYRQVQAMQYTPTGKSAFENPVHKPVKEDGTLVKGYSNTYMRQRWDTPAFTVTMDNRKISSQGNVHPGRLIKKNDNGEDLYSDPRALTLFELMLVMSLPQDWPIPANTDEAFVRRIIGEGIPPLFVKKLFNNLPE